MKNKLAKLDATLVETTTFRAIGVKCKATSIAEKALLKWALFKLPKFSSEKVLKTFASYLGRSIFDSFPGEAKVENGGNLNRTMHKLQK